MGKAYLAKYALTDGVIESYEVEETSNPLVTAEDVWLVGLHGFYRVGRDVFYSKEEAINKAEQLREKVIASLEKQIKKLKDLEFKVK